MARQIKFGDKLLLQGETLVLDNGDTNPGVIRSKSGIIEIEGNLIVTGDTTTVNSLQTSFADPKLLLNGDLTGAPTEDVGIEIGRGSATNKFLIWNETSEKWTVNGESFVAGTFEGNITGDITGNVVSAGTSTFATVDINAGTIDGTVIGASSPQVGTFTTLTATTINGALTGTVTSIANHDTDDLAEGSNNLYYTEARVDARYATLHNNADAGTLDGQDGTYYLDYTNFTNTPTVISSLANHSIDALSDVDTTTTAPVSGETIIWNGTNWVPGDSFSQADFNTAFTAKDTDDLSEGSTNLYYTDTRARTSISATGSLSYNNSTGVISYTQGNTDTIAEGSTNLYYTDARAQAVSINNLVEDTTPQLGGNLDLNTFDLSTTDPTVTLTTTLTPSLTQGTVAASSETNLSNTTVTVNDDGDYANAVSSYITLTSTELTNLDFEGEISLTYFGAAASTSNFVWRDVSDSAEQNNMITVYAPPTDEYTFTLPTDPTFPINSADADIYFKQYAYGEMTITSATTLTGNNIQLKDANGFYIDKEHVTVASLGGTSYKVVFWTHSVSVGDVIDLVSPSAQTAIFEWGTSTFSETGITMTAESFSLTSSSNDIFAMGDLNFTAGLSTGEVVGTFIYDEPSSTSILSGLTTVTIDGTGYQSATTITDVPIIMTGNVGTSNELSLVVGSATDARLWLLDSSGNLIYKLPAADGTANQVMKTDGSGDLAWADDNDTTYTSSDFTHDDLTGFVANEHIDWTTDQGAINLHAGNYTDTDTTYTAGTNVSISGTNVISSTYTDTIYTSFNTDFDTRLATKSTTNLSEGTNLYYTDTRADARAQLKIDALVGGASAAFDTLVEIENAMATDTELTNAISALNHDSLSGFVANEHIDWTQASAGTIHASNYSPDQTVSLTGSGATTITGTYPNFTISSTDTNTSTDITGNIIPATDNTYNLGSTTKKYANIYGHSVHATYADLAERYATDVPYLKGTVVVFGGEAEITVTSELKDVSVAGVISTNPALKLNADAGNSQTHPYVALKGRVPCMLIGPVSKGDLIVTADNEPGYAQSIGKNDAGHSVFAKSIETDLTDGKKVIEVSIL